MILLAVNIYIVFPPSGVVGSRLNRVIDACIGNETSGKCKNLQSFYRISFKYCRAYYDIPLIGEDAPMYAVAERNAFSEKVKTKKDGSPYYACVNSASDNFSNLTEVPDEIAQATFWLGRVPDIDVDPVMCRITYTGSDSVLWTNIPNYKNEFYKTERTYYNCIHSSAVMATAEETIKKLNDYSNNSVVKEYYRGFDIWNHEMADHACMWPSVDGGKHFNSNCLPKENEDGFPLNNFPKYMKAKEQSQDYKARKI